MKRRAWLGGALSLVVLVALDQLLTRTVLGDGMFLGVPVAPFDPPLFSPSQVQAYERIRTQVEGGKASTAKFDAELGWCNRPDSGFEQYRYDWAGARIGFEPLARTRTVSIRRIVAVGCSMTHGEEVGATESWCAQLDQGLAEVEVANLGVAAYGIDQALLRLRRDGFVLEPDEVWLGILPQAALRTTTFFRPLLDHWSLDVAFKPRFVLDAAGELELAPNPVRDLGEAVHLLEDQAAFLAAMGGRDPWIEQAPAAYAPRGSDWRHRSFAGRLWLTFREKRGRELDNAFDDTHPFGLLYTKIVQTMRRECEAHHARLRVVLLPGEDDLARRASAGVGYWEGWCARRRAEGLDVIDLTATLEGAGTRRAELFAPHGHYSAAGSALVAAHLAEVLRRP